MQNLRPDFNPFSQNVAIVKSYFKKPTVLTQGILYIIMLVLQVASVFVLMPVLRKYFDALLAIPEVAADMSTADAEFVNSFMAFYSDFFVLASIVPSVIVAGLTAAAFILIYIRSKNADPASSPKAGVTILYVLSIIQLIPIVLVSALLLLVILIMLVASIATSSGYAGDEATVMWVFTIFYAVIFGGMLTIFLMYFINQVRYYKSVLNSLSTVNLSYKGSGVFGVFSIIYGAYIALNSLSALALPSVYSSMSTLIPEISFIVDLFSIMTPVFVFSAIASAVTAATSILNGIIAIGYKNHIRNHTEGYSEFGATQQEYQYSGTCVVDPVPVNAPQPVMPEAPKAQEPQNDQPQFEPVVFNDNSVVPQATYCPRCGTPAKDGDVFCKACGTKL